MGMFMFILLLVGGQSEFSQPLYGANDFVRCRLLPTLTLGCSAAYMDANKHCLMIVTVDGQLYSW